MKTRQNNCVSFPLGGIGSGSIGLSAAGRLIDWEIQNRPDKESSNRFSHFAVKLEEDANVLDCRVLNGPLPPPYTGSGKGRFSGFGFGVTASTLAGVPHFEDAKFKGEYPFAEITFADRKFPCQIAMTAFNPLIPLNDFDSSLPGAVFVFRIANPTAKHLRCTVAGSVSNLFVGGVNCIEGGKLLLKSPLTPTNLKYGELALCCRAESVQVQSHWFRGSWLDDLNMYWNELSRPGGFSDRRYDTPIAQGGIDTGTVAGTVELAPGESKEVIFVLSWFVPNVRNDWSISPETPSPSWRNYYATKFSGAPAVNDYFMSHFERLRAESMLFKNALFGSTLPGYVIDAVAANLSILKSPTCLRLEDGGFYGFEGCHSNEGCCEGSCNHVWNYAYALPFLFPKLERSMRELDFKYNYDAGDGGFGFRLPLPLRNESNRLKCADGLLGGVIKVYRDWKICGDDAWLQAQYPFVRQSLEFVWSPQNTHQWDPDKTGILQGRQHHTLDVELFGPNAWLSGFYHAALLAAAAMAEHLADLDFAAECRLIAARGKAYLNYELFNGEYFNQKIDLKDRAVIDKFAADYYWNQETGEIKYQIANGCAIDQVLAQWHADLCGLGELFEPDKLKSALKSIYKYNFVKHLGDVVNVWRIYGLEDEAGTLICSWPHGDMPSIPLTYNSETMHGFEYQFAGHLIMHGMVQKGLQLVKAVRDRYDGVRRNPYNEMECGSNYARSMASYALLNALSGFSFDLSKKQIGFAPAVKTRPFQCFWSLDSGWGIVRLEKNTITLKVLYGKLGLTDYLVESGVRVSAVAHGRRIIAWEQHGRQITFRRTVTIGPGQPLTFKLEN